MSDAAAELRARLAAARAVQGLGTEATKAAGLLPADALPTPAELAREQVAEAIARGRLDLSGSPRWPWTDLDAVVGPMLPGELWGVFAITGNGKSTFLMSAMDCWQKRQTSTLYIPLEVDPQEMRRRWAAWRLGFDWVRVYRNEWGLLPEGAQDAHEHALEEQERNPYVHFAPPKYITLGGIEKWVRWGHANLGVRQVVLDHFQRVDHGGDNAAHRLAVHATARGLRDLARDLGIAMIAAGQLHRIPDPLDAYRPPILSRIKDAGGIGEECNVVLMLSRTLRPDLGKEDFDAFKAGRLAEPDLAEPGVMRVTCRKHRGDDSANNRRADLAVVNGKVENLVREDRMPPDWSQR